jgi:septal ring-binding cell division protein DamX
MADPSSARQTPRMVRARTAIIAAVVSLLIGVGIGAAGKSPEIASPSGIAAASQAPRITQGLSARDPTAEPTPGPTAEPTPAPTAEPTVVPVKPVVVRGSGSQKTKPFSMPEGDFTVVITGSGHSNVIIELIARGESSGELLFNEISNGKFKYSTVVYGVTAGSYYLDASVDGAWIVTFTPLP